MAKRGGKVHIAVTRRHYKGTEYKTTLLRRSYREGGRVRVTRRSGTCRIWRTG